MKSESRPEHHKNSNSFRIHPYKKQNSALNNTHALSKGGFLKKLYLCGSFKFHREMECLTHELGEKNIAYEISESKDSRGILGCLQKIDDSDVIYIVNPDGYVGRSVSVDIGYAYAKNKRMYAMYPISDPPVADLISGVMTPDELVELLRTDLLDKKR